MEKVYYWSDLAELTHKTQVEEFGFCTCEEQEYFPYSDCPTSDDWLMANSQKGATHVTKSL